MAKKGIYSTNPMLGDAQGAKKLEEPLEQRMYCTDSLVQVVFLWFGGACFCCLCVFWCWTYLSSVSMPPGGRGLPGVLRLLGSSLLLLLILGCLNNLPSWIM